MTPNPGPGMKKNSTRLSGLRLRRLEAAFDGVGAALAAVDDRRADLVPLDVLRRLDRPLGRVRRSLHARAEQPQEISRDGATTLSSMGQDALLF